MSANRQERIRSLQRRDILDAARKLLLSKGAERFSIRGLAREVGCVPGTLYLYFRDRDDLIAALVEESFEQLMAELERPLPDPSPLALLEHIMRSYIAFGLANPGHYHFAFLLPRTRRLDEARPRPHRSFAYLRDAISACVDEGLIEKVDPDLAAMGVWTGLHGITSLMITIPNFPWGDRARVVDHVVENQLAALAPRSPSNAEIGKSTHDVP
jgi:AcrR family transcriptional regulator